MERLSGTIKDILVGTTLGDGYLEPHGRGVRLQVVHCFKQKEYVEWKHKHLKSIGCSPIHYCRAEYPFWRFVTKIHPYLAELRAIFYRDSRKIVPENISELMKSPLALAVWFMDDATKDQKRKFYFFETQSCLRYEVEKLQHCLDRNFGIRTSITTGGINRGFRMYVPVKESYKLSQIVKPFMVTSMQYKLSIVPVTTEDIMSESHL